MANETTPPWKITDCASVPDHACFLCGKPAVVFLETFEYFGPFCIEHSHVSNDFQLLCPLCSSSPREPLDLRRRPWFGDAPALAEPLGVVQQCSKCGALWDVGDGFVVDAETLQAFRVDG